MINRVDLKNRAKAQIKGNIGILFVIVLIVAVIMCLSSIIPLVGILAVSGPLSLGMAKIYLNMTYGTRPQVGDTFQGFSENFLQSVLLTLLIGIFTFLWSLLFFIPGIIKGISYSMAFYIMADNPELSAMEALNESKRIMNGHKMDYFVLQLSFILWNLLGSFTFGIAYIYVMPYMQATNTNFYHAISGEYVDTEYAYNQPSKDDTVSNSNSNPDFKEVPNPQTYGETIQLNIVYKPDTPVAYPTASTNELRCPHCGANIGDGIVFCPICGKMIE